MFDHKKIIPCLIIEFVMMPTDLSNAFLKYKEVRIINGCLFEIDAANEFNFIHESSIDFQQYLAESNIENELRPEAFKFYKLLTEYIIENSLQGFDKILVYFRF